MEQSQVVAIQPFAIVDHIARVDRDILERIVGSDDELFGSRRVDTETIDAMLSSTGARHCSVCPVVPPP
jgi:hypothetical protein